MLEHLARWQSARPDHETTVSMTDVDQVRDITEGSRKVDVAESCQRTTGAQEAGSNGGSFTAVRDLQQLRFDIAFYRDERFHELDGSIAASVVNPDHLALRTPARDETNYLVSGFRESILLIEQRDDKADAGFQQH
jgi:hypothetical protein